MRQQHRQQPEENRDDACVATPASVRAVVNMGSSLHEWGTKTYSWSRAAPAEAAGRRTACGRRERAAPRSLGYSTRSPLPSGSVIGSMAVGLIEPATAKTVMVALERG